MKIKWKDYKLELAYVILLSACAPLLYLWMLYAGKIVETAGENVGIGTLFLMFLPMMLYWIVVAILGVMNIIQSFRVYKNQGVKACVNRMLIHKYGLVVFFCINFLLLALLYFIMTIGAIMGTRGLLLILAPILLPWWAFIIGWTVCTTWLVMLPGSVYSIQVIRGSVKEHKIGISAIWHMFLQFIFLTDVLDAMYLAAKKWQMGRKSSVAVAAVYVIGVIGTVVLISQF